MMNWYDMPGALDGFECNPAYLEKLEIDTDVKPIKKSTVHGKREASRTDCSWVKKRKYKKKMVRRFLTINPDMDYSKLQGMRCRPAIYLCFPSYNDGDFYDPKLTYYFNPYTQVFLSPRGDLRKYRGTAIPIHGSYSLVLKDKDIAKITNRRIRRNALDEEVNSYSYCKKSYGPWVEDLW